jgi:cold shock CspA family protein
MPQTIGTVAKWLNHKGIGFITPDGEEAGEKDILVHFSEIKQENGDGFKSLQAGSKVKYEEKDDPKNPEKKVAVNVTGEDGGDCEAKKKGQGKGRAKKKKGEGKKSKKSEDDEEGSEKKEKKKKSKKGEGKKKRGPLPKQYEAQESDEKKDTYTPETLAKALFDKTLTITYEKRDKTEATMKASLQKKCIDDAETEKIPTLFTGENSSENMVPWTTRDKKTCFTVWDTEAEKSEEEDARTGYGWRTIRWDSIKKIAK